MSKAKKSKSAFNSNKITRLDFSATHFKAWQLPSDMFYTGVANKVYPLIQKVFSAQPGFTPATSKRMAIILACYVEDLVAGSGVWAAFTSLFKKKYGKSFPFYNIREQSDFFPYDDDKPSFHAVLFLLWYVANDVNPDTVLNPGNPALRMLAMSLMPDLLKAYDDAPDTPARPILLSEEESGIPLFYQIRNLCAWLCDRCYLTRINDIDKVTTEFRDFINRMIQSVDDYDPERESYAIDSFVPMNALIGPLAIPAYEWLAEIVSLYHEPEEEEYISILETLKSRPYGYYKYETVGESELILRDVKGEILTLAAASMPGGRFSPDIMPGRSALLSLVLVDGVWLMNGLGVHGLPEEVYEECRKIHIAKEKNHKEAYKYLMMSFGKKRMGVCGSYEEYIKLAYRGDDPNAEVDTKLLADIRDAGNLLYFLNSDGIVSILPGWAQSVRMNDNPYYDSNSASHDGIALIMDHSLSTAEMRQYIIKHKLVPDAALSSVISPEAGRDMFQKNIRFLNDYSDRDTMPVVMDM